MFVFLCTQRLRLPQPKAPLSVAEVNPFKPQWAKKRQRVFLDDTVDYKSPLLTMDEILGSEELDCKLVHLIFTRAPRIPGQSEEGTRLVPNIPLIKGLRQRGSIPFTDYGSGKKMTFRYLRPLTLYDEAPFLVKLESDKMAVVKSVSRYGLGAHQSLADAGRAPQLLFFGSLDTQEDLRRSSGEGTKAAYGSHLGLQRITVIMEYINGEHAEALQADGWPKDTYAQIKEMVEILHRSDFVFGDLRPPNIVFQEGRAYLVDFDWAGKEGETFYPAELGEVITGCSGAKGLGPIKKEHDLVLLERYFNQM